MKYVESKAQHKKVDPNLDTNSVKSSFGDFGDPLYDEDYNTLSLSILDIKKSETKVFDSTLSKRSSEVLKQMYSLNPNLHQQTKFVFKDTKKTPTSRHGDIFGDVEAKGYYSTGNHIIAGCQWHDYVGCGVYSSD